MKCPYCEKSLSTILEEIQATVVVRMKIDNNTLIPEPAELLNWDITYKDDKGHRAFICDHCLKEIPDEFVVEHIKGAEKRI